MKPVQHLAPQRREHIRLLVRESGVARVEDLRTGIESFGGHNKARLRGVGGGGKGAPCPRRCGEYGNPTGGSGV